VCFQEYGAEGVFGPNKKEETVGLRKVHSEQLHDVHCTPNRIKVIQSRTTAWVGHVTHMQEWDMYTGYFVGKDEGKRLLEQPRH
jgi:hypothetical protein